MSPPFAGEVDRAKRGRVGALLRHDPPLRLRIEHEPRADATALSGGVRARVGAARRLALRHHPGRLRLARARSGRTRPRRAVAADPTRTPGPRWLRAAP